MAPQYPLKLVLKKIPLIQNAQYIKFFRSRDHANSRIPRSASIDSMVEAVWSVSPRPSLTVSPPHLVVPCGGSTTPSQSQQQHRASQQLTINYESVSRRESLLSPSTGRRAKQNRGISCKYKIYETIYFFWRPESYMTEG